MDSSPVAQNTPISTRELSTSSRRELSRALPLTYGAILVCFLFTFVNISCQGQRFVSLNGVQLAIGTTIETQTMFGGTEKKKVPAEPLVAGALVAAAAGVIVSVRGRGNRAAALAGAAGFILLLLYKSKTDGNVLRQGGGMIQVDYGGGFILAVTLFAVAVLIATGLGDRAIQRFGSSAGP
jgi:hypothetical protein